MVVREVGVDVTGAGTISQLGYVVGHIRIFVLLMRSRLEITGVAAGAGGRVSAKTPGMACALVVWQSVQPRFRACCPG